MSNTKEMRVWFAACLVVAAAGCDGKSEPTDTSTGDTATDTLEDSAADTDVDADAGDAAEDGACAGDGALGGPCVDDCDCTSGLTCLGLPGDTSCSVACIAWDACQTAVPGCASPWCDLTIGACGCPCTTDAECPGEHCVASRCVGCAEDAHCADVDCTEGEPRCRLDTQQCLCGGTCGDGDCDAHEQGTWSCPADCTGPCDDGASLPWSCMDGTRVEWCSCTGGGWVCVEDPTDLCAGDTECARTGGQCQETTEYCEGGIDPDPLGCTGTTPYCCLPLECTGPGEEYYPYLGMCCPGMVAITSLAPMEGYEPGKVICMTGCWALTCAPCGDGTCETHFDENACNCPEDCLRPAYGLSCTSAGEECGITHCVQDGGTCLERTPRCDTDGTCVVDEVAHAGMMCSSCTRSCE